MRLVNACTVPLNSARWSHEQNGHEIRQTSPEPSSVPKELCAFEHFTSPRLKFLTCKMDPKGLPCRAVGILKWQNVRPGLHKAAS